VWDHPDLLPSSEDLDDPAGYAQRRADDEQGSAAVDAAIEALLSGEKPGGEQSGSDGESTPDDGDDRGPTGA
jgi:hypothetical protein